MTISDDLMGVGIPGPAAAYLSDEFGEVRANTVSDAPTRSVATGLTAAGTVIGDALALTALVNVVGTTAASTGVKLPDVAIGQAVIVQNDGANALNVWPHSASGTLNGGSAGAAVTCAAAAGNLCTRLSATAWLVSVYAKES